MSLHFKEAFELEQKDYIAFVYERYKNYIERDLPPKEQMEWEMLQENITYERDDLHTF